MNAQINQFVEAVFSGLPKTKDVVEMKINILGHMTDQFEELTGRGMNENEALGTVIAEFGSIGELRRGLGLPEEAQEIAPLPADPELARLEEEYRAVQRRARLWRAAAMMLFILAPFGSFMLNTVMLLFVFLAAGVGLLLYWNGRVSDCREAVSRREAQLGRIVPAPEAASPEAASPEANLPAQLMPEAAPCVGRRRRIFYLMLPLLAVVLYLYLGFLWDMWHPGWIVFLCVPLVIGVLELIRADPSDPPQGGEGRDRP